METSLKFLKSLLFFGISSLIILSCSKNPEIYQALGGFSGKIIEMTCGGTVIQFVNTDSLIGETWYDSFSNENILFNNCALTGDIVKPNFIKGDTVLFNFNKVPSITGTGLWCTIGGLPRTAIQCLDITKMTDN